MPSKISGVDLTNEAIQEAAHQAVVDIVDVKDVDEEEEDENDEDADILPPMIDRHEEVSNSESEDEEEKELLPFPVRGSNG